MASGRRVDLLRRAAWAAAETYVEDSSPDSVCSSATWREPIVKLAMLLCVVFAVATSAAELPSFGPDAWKGGSPDSTIRQVWPQSVCWRHGQKAGLACAFDQPQDWSEFNSAAFWLHAEKATGSSFVVVFSSENADRRARLLRLQNHARLDGLEAIRSSVQGTQRIPPADWLEPHRRRSHDGVGLRQHAGPECGGTARRIRVAGRWRHRSADDRRGVVRGPGPQASAPGGGASSGCGR